MNCTNCGSPLTPGAAFCGNCRQQVAPQAFQQQPYQQPPAQYPPQAYQQPPYQQPPYQQPPGYPPQPGQPPYQQQPYQPPMGYGQGYQPVPQQEPWKWKWSPLIGITYGPVPVGLIIGGIILLAIYSGN